MLPPYSYFGYAQSYCKGLPLFWNLANLLTKKEGKDCPLFEEIVTLWGECDG